MRAKTFVPLILRAGGGRKSRGVQREMGHKQLQWSSCSSKTQEEESFGGGRMEARKVLMNPTKVLQFSKARSSMLALVQFIKARN